MKGEQTGSALSFLLQSHLVLCSIRRILYSRIGGACGEGRQWGQADDIVGEVRARQLRSCSNCKSRSILLYFFSSPLVVCLTARSIPSPSWMGPKNSGLLYLPLSSQHNDHLPELVSLSVHSDGVIHSIHLSSFHISASFFSGNALRHHWRSFLKPIIRSHRLLRFYFDTSSFVLLRELHSILVTCKPWRQPLVTGEWIALRRVQQQIYCFGWVRGKREFHHYQHNHLLLPSYDVRYADRQWMTIFGLLQLSTLFFCTCRFWQDTAAATYTWANSANTHAQLDSILILSDRQRQNGCAKMSVSLVRF